MPPAYPLNTLHKLVNTPLTLAQPAQAEPVQANATQFTGQYAGQVKLQWSLSGIYSDPLATPAPPPAGSPAHLTWAPLIWIYS